MKDRKIDFRVSTVIEGRQREERVMGEGRGDEEEEREVNRIKRKLKKVKFWGKYLATLCLIPLNLWCYKDWTSKHLSNYSEILSYI